MEGGVLLFNYMKMPSIQFYPADWRKDPAVQALNFHDKGVWIEILCLMHESSERGVLLLNGNPMPEHALARTLGLDKQILTTTLTTLLTYGVAKKRESDGAIYSSRMVKDEKLIQIRRDAGKKGGNPLLVKQNPTTPVKQIPTPSSSSSSSVSSSNNNTPIVPIGDENEMNAFRRARALFNMRELTNSTPIDKSLERAWKGAKEVVMATFDDEWEALEARYSSTDPEIARYRRRDLPTLLNNWTGEITKSKNQHNQFTTQPKYDHRAEKRAREFPEKIVVPLI